MRLILVLLLIASFFNLKTEEQKKEVSPSELLAEIAKKNSPAKAENIFVELNFKDESLANIINTICKAKKINIDIPDASKIKEKISSNLGKRDLNQAWNFLLLTLEKYGYTITRKDSSNYSIVSTKTVNQEPIPFYVNIPAAGIPNMEDRIRYLYYFNNINISDKSNTAAKTNIESILKDLLPEESQNNYYFDMSANSVLINSKASVIKGIMSIISELDKTGFRETIFVVPLYHANAAIVSKILNQLIPNKEPEFRFGANPTQPKFGYYFSENTKISAIDRTNSVVILGNTESVARVRDFIAKYLDKPLESGSSVVHVKPLQYIDANEIAPVLQNILKAETGTTQSVTQQQLKDTLSKVIIAVEKEQPASQLDQPQTTPVGQDQTITPQAPIVGGNSLIVAAETEDWKIIEKLIDELDTPQIQVALEVLIVDLTITDQKLLGGQSRDLAQAQREFNWQAAHLIKPWLNFVPDQLTGPNVNMTRGLAADLLQMTQASTIKLSDSSDVINLAKLANAGSTIISFNDGNGISNVLQIFYQYGNATILSQPFVTTKNHHLAKISIDETRLVRGAVQQQSSGGPVILPRDTIHADLTVQMIPRVSNTNNINLEITVSAKDFVTSDLNDNTINNRTVVTNANIGNKEVLVLGGLTKTTKTEGLLATPLLSRIPIIGYFFKRRSRTDVKTSLMIFIQPTIIKPRIGGGIDDYTMRKLNYAQQTECEFENQIEGQNFENLKDPITRVFFPSAANIANEEIEYYKEHGMYAKTDYDECCNLVDDYSYDRGDPRTCSCKEDKLKQLVQNEQNPLICNKKC